MEYRGTLITVMDEVQVTSSFRKREFVVSDNDDKYPQEVIFQLSQDRCDAIQHFSVGDEVVVSFNLRGRRWESPNGVKFFNSLDAWKVDRV